MADYSQRPQVYKNLGLRYNQTGEGNPQLTDESSVITRHYAEQKTHLMLEVFETLQWAGVVNSRNEEKVSQWVSQQCPQFLRQVLQYLTAKPIRLPF